MTEEEKALNPELNATTQTTTKKSKFGVTKETQSGSIVSIPAPIKLDKHTEQFKTGYEFPIANLVAVNYDPKKEMTIQGVKEERPVLIFIFKDNKGRQLTHLEFPLDDDDAKFESKMEWMNQRIKHIWDETIGDKLFPQEGLGQNANDFAEFFADVVEKFNAVKVGEGEKAVTTYSQRPVYIKVVYNKNRTQLPLFPNFLQRAMSGDKLGSVITLTIDPSRDNIEPSAKVAPAAYSGGTDNTFGASNSAYAGSDFPDV